MVQVSQTLPAMLRIFFSLAILVSLASAQAASLSPSGRGVRVMAEQGSIDPAEFEAAVNKLHELGIVADPQFWIDNVKPGKFIASTEIQPVVIAAAGKFQPVTTVEEAISILGEHKILMNREKWNDLATKPKIASGVTFLLFMALAKSIN